MVATLTEAGRASGLLAAPPSGNGAGLVRSRGRIMRGDSVGSAVSTRRPAGRAASRPEARPASVSVATMRSPPWRAA